MTPPLRGRKEDGLPFKPKRVKPRPRPELGYAPNRTGRRAPVSLRRAVLALCVLLAAWGQAMSYTVQVVAVSSQERALSLVADLSRQGYPAYLLTVPTPQGLVYRIRVGAFANREAAARYAAALPALGDSRPTPALAENVPAGLSPLAPALLGAYPLDTVGLQVLPWRGGVALRVQPRDAVQQATYTLLDGTATPPSFSAWRAAPQDDGTVVRVYNFPLWPDDRPTLSAPERESYRQTVLGNLARPVRFERRRAGDVCLRPGKHRRRAVSRPRRTLRPRDRLS